MKGWHPAQSHRCLDGATLLRAGENDRRKGRKGRKPNKRPGRPEDLFVPQHMTREVNEMATCSPRSAVAAEKSSCSAGTPPRNRQGASCRHPVESPVGPAKNDCRTTGNTGNSSAARRNRKGSAAAPRHAGSTAANLSTTTLDCRSRT